MKAGLIEALQPVGGVKQYPAPARKMGSGRSSRCGRKDNWRVGRAVSDRPLVLLCYGHCRPFRMPSGGSGAAEAEKRLCDPLRRGCRCPRGSCILSSDEGRVETLGLTPKDPPTPNRLAPTNTPGDPSPGHSSQFSFPPVAISFSSCGKLQEGSYAGSAPWRLKIKS